MGSPLGPFLCPEGFVGPSGWRAMVRETSAVVEAGRLVRRSTGDRIHRRDMSHSPWTPLRSIDPVVLVPGFLAGDSSMLLMARHMRRLGFRTYRSTMHANVGCTQQASSALERRIESIVIKRDRKVTIIGHSLGGLLARSIAVRRPDLVDGIITMGSPMLAPGAVHSVLALDLAIVIVLRRAGLRTMMGRDCTSGDCARLSWEQSQAKLGSSVSFTSIFSRRDGVVDWRSCLDPAAETVEVATSHMGMAVDPVVFDIVSHALRRGRERRRVAAGTSTGVSPDVSTVSAAGLRPGCR